MFKRPILGEMKAFSFQETGLFLPLRLGRTARETLQEFIDIDVTAGDLVRILNANQAYRDLFFRFVSQKTAKTEKTESGPETKDKVSPTHRLIGLLGMLGSRNLILALRIHRLAEGRFPITNENQVEIQAGDYLKHALEAEELLQRNKLEYSETAYAAGVYYDLCLRLYQKEKGFKELEPHFKRTWQRAMRTGLIAYFLAECVQGYSPKTAVAAGMLAHAGKMHLAVWLQEAGYVNFEKDLDTNPKLPALACMLMERNKFGVVQEEVGAHTLRYFDVFKSFIPVVRSFREPYCLKGIDAAGHGLAVILWLADAMARSGKIPVDEQDSVFADWSYPGLSALRIKRSTLIEVMKKAMTLK